ncbi:hypothetical protein [Gordonia polyisoprenivorans]|uniref:hypothetical protein n=1 Tax=Gordonia polyisoprenivorans TaxID=84595 RepID=UPI001FCC2FB2|nr:hypothetical protein [Gordonia polyisoprenivorans]
MTVSRRWGALCVLAVIATICGCDTSTPPSRVSGSSVQHESLRLDPRECARTPPTGAIDRVAYDLRFTRGRMLVAVSPSGGTGRCYSFAKSGNAGPEVPPDSLLFTFSGPGTDGAQLEFLAGDLTGGGPPPVAGTPAPGPLTGPITALVGVLVHGVYRSSATCRLTVTAMSSTLAAGHFTCPEATASTANPFSPNDEGPFEDSSTPAMPSDADTATLSGWFELTP